MLESFFIQCYCVSSTLSEILAVCRIKLRGNHHKSSLYLSFIYLSNMYTQLSSITVVSFTSGKFTLEGLLAQVAKAERLLTNRSESARKT